MHQKESPKGPIIFSYKNLCFFYKVLKHLGEKHGVFKASIFFANQCKVIVKQVARMPRFMHKGFEDLEMAGWVGGVAG